ncbi:MAG: FxsA family protein [bacterium]
MFYKLLLLFTVVPFVELMLLLEVGRVIGVLPTLMVIVITGIIGATLARIQGLSTLNRIRAELQEGRLPADAMIDGVLILAAALVLLTPGFLTDLVGFFLLIPLGRSLIRARLRNYFRNKLMVQTTYTAPYDSRSDDYVE